MEKPGLNSQTQDEFVQLCKEAVEFIKPYTSYDPEYLDVDAQLDGTIDEIKAFKDNITMTINVVRDKLSNNSQLVGYLTDFTVVDDYRDDLPPEPIHTTLEKAPAPTAKLNEDERTMLKIKLDKIACKIQDKFDKLMNEVS